MRSELKTLSVSGANIMNRYIQMWDHTFTMVDGDVVVITEGTGSGCYWCTPISKLQPEGVDVWGDNYTWLLGEDDFKELKC